jgi:hypothetical protein
VTDAISYDHSPIDLIRARTSVRSFTGQILAGKARRILEGCCGALSRGPFGGSCRFCLVDTISGEGRQAERVGTYGTIRGARSYLAGAAEQKDRGLEDFGYLFELLLLKATDLELGTCWLGGVFTRGRFAEAIGLQSTEILPAVSPVGVPAGKRSIVDRLIRWGAGSQHRKPWTELFHDGRSGAPLSRKQEGRFATALEMVRLAPSASNRQPWRCCLEDEQAVHFYLQRTPGYRSLLPADLQRIDMGIAISHFDLAVHSAGMEGRWQVLDPPPSLRLPEAWQSTEYLVSWRSDP